MSSLSHPLHSNQTGCPGGRVANRAEGKVCVEGLEGLLGPEFWKRQLTFQGGFRGPPHDGLVLVTSDIAPTSPSALNTSVDLQRRLGRSTYRRMHSKSHMTTDGHAFAEALKNMQTHIDADVQAQAFSHPHLDNCGHVEVNAATGSDDSEFSKALSPEAINKTSLQSLSLALSTHPASSKLLVPAKSAEADTPPSFRHVAAAQNPNSGSSPPIMETERKYALRSSGRPRFPCHLRKSSRLHRSIEDGGRGVGKEKGGEEEDLLEKIWMVKEEEVTLGRKEEPPPPVEIILPTISGHTDTTPPPPPPVVPKPAPKPGPRLGHRPGPKSRCKPPLKPVHKAAPKSILKRRLAAQALQQGGTPPLPHESTFPVPLQPIRVDSAAGIGTCPPNSRRRHFVGVRKIVVKVPRIPVSLSRRQKSYKISNLETVTGTEKNNDGSVESAEASREPTALLRMKNNGKSVMVMFPPGEVPVILKRRRGRPPKQAVPGMLGEAPNAGSAAVTGEQPKKPRRRRRTKLPCPYPSYVNDTNDVKTEYGDVLSKLAFLNRQPPTTGRCSPPRCWTPSEPESFHAPLENPGISTLLHRLTGCRRPRGGRGGGLGRGAAAAAAGGVMGSECAKSTFSDFFESIGKKRKLNLLSQHGLPRKRRKGVGGGVGRGGGMVGTEPGGEKIVKRKRMKKNGSLKGGGMPMGQEWPNGAGGWEEEMVDKDSLFGGYQFCGSPRGGFSSCDVRRGGSYISPTGIKGGGASGEDSQGLFAGYFRSLLDSDDSSDLLDSSQRDPRKSSSTTGFEPSSSAAGHSWSPPFPKWSSKGASAGADGAAQAHCSPARAPYSYGCLAQTSPTTSSYPKSTPPALSLSPSSPHPASYGHYSSGYSCSSSAVPQRSSDCSFPYGSAHSSSKGPASSQMGFSSFQASTKRGYSVYPSVVKGESARPTSPGGGYMSMAKGSYFHSSGQEGYKQYNSNQWSCRQAFSGWPADNFGSQYHGYTEYGSNESKDILDISNYTPQKAKRQPFSESLSESSSDSSHLGSAAPVSGPCATGASFRQNEAGAVGGGGGQSSLSSLEKLMMDWHESASGPSYNWSQDVLFQGGGTNKPGRGRRKRTETQLEKEGGTGLHSDSPSSPSPTPHIGPKRGGVGGRGRGSRGGRGGLSPCQRERPTGSKGRGKSASTSGVGLVVSSGGPESLGLFQEGLDYYSGDSSSLSPLATPNPALPSSYVQDTCEYPSPYSAHPSTPSSEERYPALYPGESSSSLSPGVSSPPYNAKPTPPPPQSYHLLPSRTFSPSCSPSPRLTPHCGTALSPSQRPPPKEPQFSQYDSPSYCGSPYWYGQTSHSSSPSPHSHSSAAVHGQSNPHASPLGHTHPTSLSNPPSNMHTTMNAQDTHQSHSNLSSHTNAHLQSGQPHHNMHLSTHMHAPHSTPVHYEERSPPSALTPLKRDLPPHATTTGFRQAQLHHSPYAKPPLDSSPHQEDASGYSLPQQPYQGVGHRYTSQPAQGGGVLCQLLDPANEESFNVTSL